MADEKHSALFCENETNSQRLYNYFKEGTSKDGINDFLVHGKKEAVNTHHKGTKAAFNYELKIPAGGSKIIKLRLSADFYSDPFKDFDQIFKARISEADEFFEDIQKKITEKDNKDIQRQAIAGMLWSKQFFYYDVAQWLKGDPSQPPPPPERKKGRNSEWLHLNNCGYYFNARQMGVSMVCGVGPGISYDSACYCRSGICETSIEIAYQRMVHAS